MCMGTIPISSATAAARVIETRQPSLYSNLNSQASLCWSMRIYPVEEERGRGEMRRMEGEQSLER